MNELMVEVKKIEDTIIENIKSQHPHKIVKIKGLWEGMHTEEKDIEKAKKSLFKVNLF